MTKRVVAVSLRKRQDCGVNSIMFLHEVSIANSFYPIEDSVNNRQCLTLT